MRGSGIKPVFYSILLTLHALLKSESITVHYCTAASRLQRPDIDTDTVVPDIKHIRRLEEHLKADEIYYTPLVSICLGQILPLARMPDFMKNKTETGEIVHHQRFSSGFRCFLTQFNIDVVICGEISLEDNPICDCPKM